MFNINCKKVGATDLANFRVVCWEDFATVEDIFQTDSFLYDFDIVDGYTIDELTRRSIKKHLITGGLLRYNSHHCYISHNNVLFKA